MSLFRRRRWCYGMIYWRCYSSHKCTIVRTAVKHIIQNKKSPPPLLQSPHPTVATKRKRRRKWALMERSLLYFFLVSSYWADMLLRGRVLCAVRHTVALAAKRPRWVLLVGALFFLSLSQFRAVCIPLPALCLSICASHATVLVYCRTPARPVTCRPLYPLSILLFELLLLLLLLLLSLFCLFVLLLVVTDWITQKSNRQVKLSPPHIGLS